MEPKLERITPKKAEQYLNSNNANRALRTGVVEKYADDMRNGAWTQCIAPIAFYDDGEVADGQHRLWAIVESGTTQSFLVVRDLPRTAGLNIDTGLSRTLADNADISGAARGTVTTGLLSVSRSIELGQRPDSGTSNTRKLEILERHRDATSFAVNQGPKGKYMMAAPVLAAIGRAWYYEKDKEDALARLKHFSAVMSTGFGNGDEDSAAITLRNTLMTNATKGITATAIWRELFLKAQNCVWYFVRRKPLFVLKKIDEEKYPLPPQFKPLPPAPKMKRSAAKKKVAK